MGETGVGVLAGGATGLLIDAPRAPATFGIEEEFVFLDRRTLQTVDLGARAIVALGRGADRAVTGEFFPSQVEFSTPVCTRSGEAFDAVLEFRGALAAFADAAEVVVAGTGTPFRAAPRADVWSGRYATIAEDIAGLATEHQLNGLHVHVGIPDRDAGVRASNFLRPWLPALLALSANSPFWQGCDTGFASWRAIQSRRWTTHSTPPYFADAAEYDAALARLAGVGATSDAGTINWHARLSRRYPTLEVRVCDAQLDPRSSVALAALIRALVVEGFDVDTPRPGRYEGWDAAHWHAARHGTGSTLIDPASGRPVPAVVVIDALRTIAERHLDTEGRRETAGFFAELERSGTGASRQRRAHAAGMLANLYRSRLAGD